MSPRVHVIPKWAWVALIIIFGLWAGIPYLIWGRAEC
jgi:hypothetical protein